MGFGRMSGADGWRHEALSCIKSNPGRVGMITRRQQCGSFCCGFERFGDDDGDRLVGVTDLVALQQIEPKHERICLFVRILCERGLVGRRHHFDNSGMVFRGPNIERSNVAARNATHGEHGVEHSRRMVVGGVSGSAGDFKEPVAAGERLPHVRTMSNMGRSLRECDLRHG